MAGTVDRIVPPSVPLEQAAAVRGEKRKRQREDSREGEEQATAQSPSPLEEEEEKEKEGKKGGLLDVKA